MNNNETGLLWRRALRSSGLCVVWKTLKWTFAEIQEMRNGMRSSRNSAAAAQWVFALLRLKMQKKREKNNIYAINCETSHNKRPTVAWIEEAARYNAINHARRGRLAITKLSESIAPCVSSRKMKRLIVDEVIYRWSMRNIAFNLQLFVGLASVLCIRCSSAEKREF